MFEVQERDVAILSTYLFIPYENQLIKASKGENLKKKYGILSGNQDGGIGRHTAPPCTTKRRTTTI